jgi:eukaryotic-like serine/threonine-protein kinase
MSDVVQDKNRDSNSNGATAETSNVSETLDESDIVAETSAPFVISPPAIESVPLRSSSSESSSSLVGAGPGALKPNDIFGRYKMVRDLGAGGMAQVFLASLKGPDGFEKMCVVKKILPQYAKDPNFSQMFINEARIAAMMSHQNIVQTFEFSKENDEYFIAMEYVSGASLERTMRSAKKLGMTGDVRLAVDVGIGIAQALSYAHEFAKPDGTSMNIVHRDISPENILLSRDSGVKLADFGVVKADLDEGVTVAGVVKGKWSYMSPEQVVSGPLDGRSDLFSLGIVLYEVALGKRLFRGESLPATVEAVMRAEVVAPHTIQPDFPMQLEHILLKALSKSPLKRYQTGAEMAADLEAFRSAQRWTPDHVGKVVNHLFPRDGTQPGAYLRLGTGSGRSELGVAAKALEEAEREAENSLNISVEVEEAEENRLPKWVVFCAVGACVLGSALFWYVMF